MSTTEPPPAHAPAAGPLAHGPVGQSPIPSDLEANQAISGGSSLLRAWPRAGPNPPGSGGLGKSRDVHGGSATCPPAKRTSSSDPLADPPGADGAESSESSSSQASMAQSGTCPAVPHASTPFRAWCRARLRAHRPHCKQGQNKQDEAQQPYQRVIKKLTHDAGCQARPGPRSSVLRAGRQGEPAPGEPRCRDRSGRVGLDSASA